MTELFDSIENTSSWLANVDGLNYIGRIAEAYGTLIKVTGVNPRIGDLCELKDPNTGQVLLAETIGLAGKYAMLTPMGGLEGVYANMEVRVLADKASISVDDSLLGRVINAHGEAIDGKPAPDCVHSVPIYQEAPNPMSRLPIKNPLPTGVKAIDAMLTLGLGQRVGIFASAGGGKSTLMGMLARGAQADVIVIVLVGERGREVSEFIEDSLGPEGLSRSVLVVATADKPALERSRAAYTGHAIAEYFRSQGKRVLLLMDSVTRYARALREIGLALGEPPARRGFPPSVFANLPKLFERAGNDAHGYLTAIYTVLAEDEEDDDPVSEEVRSLLDGHIILTRKLAAAAHYPAIDVLNSASRVMNRVVSDTHLQQAMKVRERMSKYKQIELLLQLGEYQSGSDSDADQAIAAHKIILELLQQRVSELQSFEKTVAQLEAIP